MDYQVIRNTIISRLHKALGMPVILSDQTGERPAFPFVSYTVTSPYLPLGGPIKTILTADGMPYELTTYQIEIVFSFTAHDAAADGAITTALKMVDYYQRTAQTELASAGIVIVNVSDVQNRDQILVMEYERRSGLDVRFRVIDQTIGPAEIIETADIHEV